MSPLVKSHHEFLVEDLDCGRYVEQVSEYRLRGRLPVFVADPLRQGRSGVALGFLESNEFRIGMVTAFYSNFLLRAPDAAGLAAWVASGQSLDHIRQGFEMSGEFLANG